MRISQLDGMVFITTNKRKEYKLCKYSAELLAENIGSVVGVEETDGFENENIWFDATFVIPRGVYDVSEVKELWKLTKQELKFDRHQEIIKTL